MDTVKQHPVSQEVCIGMVKSMAPCGNENLSEEERQQFLEKLDWKSPSLSEKEITCLEKFLCKYKNVFALTLSELAVNGLSQKVWMISRCWVLLLRNI